MIIIITKFLLNTTRLRPRLTKHKADAAVCCGSTATEHSVPGNKKVINILLTTGSVAEFFTEPDAQVFRRHRRDDSLERRAGNTTRTFATNSVTRWVSHNGPSSRHCRQSVSWLRVFRTSLLTNTVRWWRHMQRRWIWKWSIFLKPSGWTRRPTVRAGYPGETWSSATAFEHKRAFHSRSALRALSVLAARSHWLANTSQKLRMAKLRNCWSCCQQRVRFGWCRTLWV